MGERRGTKGLELWCRRMTEGYPGVKVDNMTTSWRDGLAFCAIIHHFRPDLIDFSKLNKDDIHYNNKLAFRIAEDHLGIPALLEPEDMVEYSVPDRLSILTYLSQFYKAFAVQQSNSPTKISPKRPPPTELQMHMATSASTPPKKAAFHGLGVRREPCTRCNLPVFIAERLNVGKTLYHRTCFRCARCDSQLTLANYYETENDEFCCETCPDEERTPKPATDILKRALSDEEKTASLKGDSDLYSASFEDVLEDSEDIVLRRNFTLNRDSNSFHITARSNFMTTQLVSSPSGSESGSEKEPPPLPKSEIPLDLMKGHIEHSENNNVSSNNPLPNLSDFISFKLDDQHLPDQKRYESQNLVTKDNNSNGDESSEAPPIKCRIKLFEGDDENRRQLSKSDVNTESLTLSKLNNEVPFDNESVDVSLSPVHSFAENKKADVLKHSDSDNLTDKAQCITEVEAETKIDSDVSNIDYEADTSSINPLVLSDPSEAIIVISSDSEPIFVVSSESQSDISSVINSTVDSRTKNLGISVNEENFEVKSEISSSEVYVNEVNTQKNSRNPEENLSQPKQYPDDLNPFDDEEDEAEPSKSVSLNPFGDTDEESEEEKEHVQIKKPVATPRKANVLKTGALPDQARKAVILNPFGSDDDEEEETIATRNHPEPAQRKLLRAPRISLGPIEVTGNNPFGSDDEETNDTYTSQSLPPQPTTRKLLRAPKISLGPLLDDSMDSGPKYSLSGFMGRSSQDVESLTGSGRKKKPAPKPPTAASVFGQDTYESPISSVASSPSQSVCHSPKSVRARKMRRAPLPPTSTPFGKSQELSNISPKNISPIENAKPLQFRIGSEENLKTVKNEMNRSKQHSANIPPDEGPTSLPNKSTYGKWKRRKGQAPPRPVAQRRCIQSLPINKIKDELDLIEIQQLGLEKQGVKLEKLIRERSEVPGVNADEALPPEVEDMILELFDLVNEKNELLRRQTELMYLRRQHRLEVEQADLEYQVRCLMLTPDSAKTDVDKTKEEELIRSLVEIVERRNEIVDCLEMDRQRKEEEDMSIRTQMSLFSIRREECSSPKKKKSGKKQKHKKEKGKEKKSKHNEDVDKDIDESETPSLKEKKKKKLFSILNFS